MRKIASLFTVTCTLAVILASALITSCGSSTKEEGDVYLTLVNKDHALPEDWEKRVKFALSKDPWGDDVIVELTTLEQFEKLQAALLEKGIDIRLDSAFRSIDDQIDTWNYFKKERGIEYCEQYLALPGYSEHHTGLAIDVCMMINGEPDNDNDHMLAEKDLFAEVHALMPEYGFILRYPEGCEDITGYLYEPWHLRYVGIEAAKEITEKNLTLEEYLSAVL